MKIQRFEDIIAWQKARGLAIAVYHAFQPLKDFGFKDQICRAAVSVSNNIAEGFDRMSDAEFVRFLYISLGSCSEVKSMLYLARDLNYISQEDFNKLSENATEVSKIMTGLIKSIKKNG